jgi:hypothetical protein
MVANIEHNTKVDVGFKRNTKVAEVDIGLSF